MPDRWSDRWMDEREQDERDRDWRRSERFSRGYGRSDDDRYRGETGGRSGEARSWAGGADDEGGAYEETGRRGRDYGEDDQDYEARARGGFGAGYGRGAGVRGQAYGRGQAPYGSQAQRFSTQDYARGRYADEAGRTDYGYTSSSGRYGDEPDWRRRAEGYGARRGWDDDRERRRESERGEEGGGDFLQRAGERISSWFRGDDRGHSDAEPGGTRRYSADYGREPRWEVSDRGHRGRGPKGYQRSDERINEEAHERLTDDPWLDASNIQVEVKGGEVTLSGHVDNREAKHRAERLIEDLSGVTHVQNNLRVNPDAGLTSAGRGYGSSALEAEMRRNAQATNPGDNGASGLSGRTSTGAAAERSTGMTGDGDSKTRR